MIINATLTTYGDQVKDHTVNINAYWVTIKHDKEVLFKREATGNGPWLDAKHVAITEALALLEQALNDAIS